MKKGFVLALLALAGGAWAHEVPCPLCGLKVVQSTKDQDNEVVLRYGKKKIEYRCVYCVLVDAAKYEGDLYVYAPSETKGKPIILLRTEGKWAAVKDVDGKLVPEEGVVFLNDFSDHGKCALRSRAFRSKEALEKYAKGAKALTLEEMLEVVKKR